MLFEPDDTFYKRCRIKCTGLYLISFLLALIVIFYVVRIQSDEEYKNTDDPLGVLWEEVTPTRGTIFSDDGQILAVDILRYSLSFDPDAAGLCNPVNGAYFMENADTLALALSQVFEDKSWAEYYQFLTDKLKNHVKGNYTLGNRRITAGELARIKAMTPLLDISKYKSGIIVTTFSRREYPHGNIARRTVGLKNSSVTTGLEKNLNDRLAGKKGVQKMARVTSDIWRPQHDVNNVEAQNGQDVHTTIDIKLQDFTQKALLKQIEEFKGVWGTAIVLDVATADVKAVANVAYNKDSSKYEAERYDWEFYAIQHNVSPGSTFKTVSLMCMLDDKNIPMSETFNTNASKDREGKVRLVKGSDAAITDDHSVGTVNVQQILEQSSNIGMAMIAHKYYNDNPGRLVSRIEETGIYRPLDLVIPTGTVPIYHRPGSKYWSAGGFLKMTFGLTVDLTPMHMAMFYNGLANNGVMLNPRFVTHFTDSRNHETVDTIPVKVLNAQLCSNETLKHIQDCLEGVVTRGTGRLTVGPAKFKCAGKTGTAPLPNRNAGFEGGMYKYYASFAGYFPADKPRYTVFVGIELHLNYPRERLHSGAYVAGPVFRDIADYIYDREKQTTVQSQNSEKTAVRGHARAAYGDPDKLENTLRQMGVNMQISGENGKYYGIDSLGMVTRDVRQDSIPDLRGFAFSDALSILYERGYSVSVVGEGNVQSVEFDGKTAKLYLK